MTADVVGQKASRKLFLSPMQVSEVLPHRQEKHPCPGGPFLVCDCSHGAQEVGVLLHNDHTLLS